MLGQKLSFGGGMIARRDSRGLRRGGGVGRGVHCGLLRIAGRVRVVLLNLEKGCGLLHLRALCGVGRIVCGSP
jgi:hypothetical protein